MQVRQPGTVVVETEAGLRTQREHPQAWSRVGHIQQRGPLRPDLRPSAAKLHGPSGRAVLGRSTAAAPRIAPRSPREAGLLFLQAFRR